MLLLRYHLLPVYRHSYLYLYCYPLLSDRSLLQSSYLLLLSDHTTYMANGAHGADPVPFVLYDSRVSEGSGLPYSEANGRKGPYVDDGAERMELLFELKKL